MEKLVFATNNSHKLHEIKEMLDNSFELLSLNEIGCSDDIPETGETLEANASQKSFYIWDRFHFDCFADDTGLEIEALNNEPGVYSARYAGDPKSDARNNEKLLTHLKEHANRKAHFYCVLVLVRAANDPQPIIAEGEWHGEIVDAPRGNGGFGYDPYFVLPEAGMTAAELDADRKNRESHRGQALVQLVERLKNRRA